MVSMIKVVAICMGIVFLDVIIQIITGGGLVLQGERYTVVQLITLFLQLIATFLGIIVHAITHPYQIGNDILLIITGLLAVLWFIIESVVDLFLHFIRLPFEFIGSALASQGVPFGLEIDLWAIGSLFIDFRTLSFGVTIPNVHIELLGVYADFENTIIISILGTSSDTFFLASLSVTDVFTAGDILAVASTKYKTVPANFNNFIAISIFVEDVLWSQPPTGYVSIPPTQLIEMPVEATGNLGQFLEDLISMINIPSLRDWISEAWETLGLTVEPTTASLIHLIQNVEFDLQKVIYKWEKMKVMDYRYQILDMVSL